VGFCVNDNYIVIHYHDALFFCNHDDLSVINRTKITFSNCFTCTQNAAYLVPSGRGLLSYTPRGLGMTKLFKDLNIRSVAGDIETDLLYFCCVNDNKMNVGNEQDEVLYQFLWPVLGTTMRTVSYNMIISNEPGHLVFYNKDGKQINEIRDDRIRVGDVCLVYDKGILVTTDYYNDAQINLWRVV
jgi:hypothetical protein